MRIQLLSMMFVSSLLGMESDVQDVFTALMRTIQKPPQVPIALVNEKDREKQIEQLLQKEEEKKYLQKMTTYTLWKRKKSNI